MNYDNFKKINIKPKIHAGFLYLCFFIVSAVALTETYANPLLKEVPRADSSAFLAMAWFKQKGFIIYKDYFDHKGPLLYFINDIFAHGKNYWTIWIYEMISLFASACFIYETIKIFYKKNIAFISTIYAIFVFGMLCGGGNGVEEYALPFICAGLYVFSYILNQEKKINWAKPIVLGVTCGAVLMLRPNMASVWLVFGSGLFIYYSINKKYDEAIKLSLGFFIGLLISLVPFLMYFLKNNALLDFYECYWLYNIEYSSTSIQQIISSEWRMLVKLQEYNGLVLLGLLFSFNILNIKRTKNKEQIVYSVLFIFYVFFQLLLIDMSGKGYAHYYICFVPILAFGFALLINIVCDYIKRINPFVTNHLVLLGILLIVLSGILIPRTGLFVAKRIKEIHNPEHSTAELQQVIECVQKNTETSDTILCLGAGLGFSSIYWAAERLPASRYYFTPPAEGQLKDEIFSTIQNDIQDCKPEVIIRDIQNKYLDEINLKGYRLTKQYGSNQIYMLK